MSAPGAGPVERRSRVSSLWRERRARWTLPLVIILIIAAVAIVVGGRVAATLAIRDPVRGPALLVTGASYADVDSMTHAVCD